MFLKIWTSVQCRQFALFSFDVSLYSRAILIMIKSLLLRGGRKQFWLCFSVVMTVSADRCRNQINLNQPNITEKSAATGTTDRKSVSLFRLLSKEKGFMLWIRDVFLHVLVKWSHISSFIIFFAVAAFLHNPSWFQCVAVVALSVKLDYISREPIVSWSKLLISCRSGKTQRSTAHDTVCRDNLEDFNREGSIQHATSSWRTERIMNMRTGIWQCC